MGDPARYDTGNLKTNQLPFTQERVSHIDVKSPLNRRIDQMIADSTNIDKLRADSNPKLTFKGKVLSGKNMNETRGMESMIFKNQPDQSYENTADKWLVTTGSVIEKSQRPLHVMPETNRSVINHQPIGSAAPTRPIKRGLVKSFQLLTRGNLSRERRASLCMTPKLDNAAPYHRY